MYSLQTGPFHSSQFSGKKPHSSFEMLAELNSGLDDGVKPPKYHVYSRELFFHCLHVTLFCREKYFFAVVTRDRREQQFRYDTDSFYRLYIDTETDTDTWNWSQLRPILIHILGYVLGLILIPKLYLHIRILTNLTKKAQASWSILELIPRLNINWSRLILMPKG